MSDNANDPSIVDPAAVAGLMKRAKRFAKEYRRLTGRPLGITGEVAEYEACRLLKYCIASVRQEGYDAIKKTPRGPKRVQIKGRVLPTNAKPGQRLGRITFKHKWDSVVVVLLDEDFEATVIYEVNRARIKKALTAPGSKARTD